MTIILFIIILGIVVISHEFGHFIVARANGIHVVEFAVGMGPTLFHIDGKATRYSIRLLPIGGACVFDGLDGLEGETEKKKEQTSEKSEGIGRTGDSDFHPEFDQGGSFLDASIWARITTIFAGPLFNLILGVLIAFIMVGWNGTDLPEIQAIMEDSAAQEAGLMAGDIITNMDGEEIHLYREISLNSALNSKGKPMTITYERNGEANTVTLVPKYSEEDQRYYIGLMGSGRYVECKGLDILKYGFYESRFIVNNTLKSLLMLVTGNLNKNDVSGPVGVASYVGEAYEEVKDYGASAVIFTTLNFILILAINLGIMNLLPIPALDGGRLVFLLIELIRGKPMPPEKEGMVHFAGMVLFFVIMILVMYNDIMKIITP